jgi:anti-anti-sigma factor
VTLRHVAARTDDRITIVVASEADLARADDLRNALFDAVNERRREILVDLHNLAFIDSMSIGILTTARRARTSLCVRGDQPNRARGSRVQDRRRAVYPYGPGRIRGAARLSVTASSVVGL